MRSETEVELKLLVPAGLRAKLMSELNRGATRATRITLAATYLDTPDRRLAREGLAWRVRREGRHWVQTLKAAGASALERFEHEVDRPDSSPDLQAHAGTVAGDRLIKLVHAAQAQGQAVGPRFSTEVRRTIRRVRTRGATVDVTFDEGRLLAGESVERIREIEFELVSGTAPAMLALVERWRHRFGLIYDPRSKAERGHRLAEGSRFPRVRKARLPDYPRRATAVEAFGAVFDECLAQITANAIGLAAGDPSQHSAHVHQTRVGIRRLRSAWRCFQGWGLAPSVPWADSLRTLFGQLGLVRDSDVLDSGVAVELAQAGAPALAREKAQAMPDAAALIRSPETQALLLALISWRATLGASVDAATQATGVQDTAPGTTPAGEQSAAQADRHRPADFRRQARQRLGRWHRRIAADVAAFDTLDEPGLHALRKRIKRQRYAVEFLAPVLKGSQVERYLAALAAVQDQMGEINDLCVAQALYQARVATEPAAWFALGWLAARIVQKRAMARPLLRALAKTDPPGR